MIATGEALPPSPPPSQPRPLVGPLLFFIAIMAIIGKLSLITLALIVAIAFIIRAVRRHRQTYDRLPK